MVFIEGNAGSSNGRTSPFGGEYLGSNPSPAINWRRQFIAGRRAPSRSPAWIRTAERCVASRRDRELRPRNFRATARKYPGVNPRPIVHQRPLENRGFPRHPCPAIYLSAAENTASSEIPSRDHSRPRNFRTSSADPGQEISGGRIQVRIRVMKS